ncbi:MAG: adenosylmethionine decarboxylase [Candidatus Zixiibacteriota bacterium]|nr:MAG: adenosylmethionine decarboxylase [candidate division Zixibacteria bacterium]
MKILGRHLVVELADCDPKVLDDPVLLESYLNESVRRSGATIVKSVFHRYNPQGVSGVVVIAESHISVHTWPEYGYAAADFFTCGESVDPLRAFEYLKESLKAKSVHMVEIKRGIPSAVDEIIVHKTTEHPFVAPSATR